MSNYNLQLQNNNTELQAILNKINTLPENNGQTSVKVDDFITMDISNCTNNRISMVGQGALPMLVD